MTFSPKIFRLKFDPPKLKIPRFIMLQPRFGGIKTPFLAVWRLPSVASFVRCSLTIYGLVYPLVLYSMVSGGVFLS